MQNSKETMEDNEIYELIKKGYSKKQVHKLYGKKYGRARIERAFRNFMVNEIEQPIKDPDKILKQRKKELAERLQVKITGEPIKQQPIDVYSYLIMQILKGKNLSEICENNKKYLGSEMIETFKKLESIARYKSQDYSCAWVIYEKILYLLKAVRQKDINSTIKRVKREIEPFNKCQYGKIDNIIINVFDDNEYKAYYVFTRMKEQIWFGQKYDQFVYYKLKKETQVALENIADMIRKEDPAKPFTNNRIKEQIDNVER